MIVIPTGLLETKAKALLQFEAFNDAADLAVLLKKVGVDLVHLLNTVVPDSRLSKEERVEYVCQSILAALDDVEKVGTKLLEESIAKEKTTDALKRIEEARSFVKNQLPEMLDLSLAVNDAVADGKLELREVVEIAEAARKVDWAAFAACFLACFSKKAVDAVAPVPAAAPAPAPAPAAVPPLPESPIQQPPLTQPQEVPELQEVPEPPQSSPPLQQNEKSPENDEVDHP